MIRKNIQIAKTARYFLSGKPSAAIKQVWFVCHGYGQLAEFFLQKFEALNDGEHLIVAPEGLHRYYLNGFSGRVGASWMTKEERESDITDYIGFLDAVHREVLSTLSPGVKVTALGFSQGAATASRWVAYGNSRIDSMVLWAGLFPNDMNFETGSNRLQKTSNFLVIGDQDEFIKLINIEEQENVLKAAHIPYQLISFSGKHEIPADVLEEVGRLEK